MWSAIFLMASIAAQEPPSLDAFLKELSIKRANVHSVSASFVQEDLNMEQKEKVSGTLLYVAPRRIIFRYAKPEIVYLIDGAKVYEYDAELGQVQIYDTPDAEMEALYIGFEADAARLREAYVLEPFLPVGESRAAAGLMLTPKGEKKLFEKTRLYLQDKDYLPCMVHIVNGPDSEVITRLSDFRVNAPVKPDDAVLVLPAGTTIIDNGKRAGTVEQDGKRLPEASAQADAPQAAKGSTTP